MKNTLKTATLILSLAILAPCLSFSKPRPAPKPAPQEAKSTQGPMVVGVTTSAHNIVFTWTAFTSTIPNLTVEISCGPTAGSESSTTPIISGLSPNSGTGTWTGPTAGTKYYCVGYSTAPNPAGGTTYSVPSNEVSSTVPLVQGDLPVLGGFGGSAN